MPPKRSMAAWTAAETSPLDDTSAASASAVSAPPAARDLRRSGGKRAAIAIDQRHAGAGPRHVQRGRQADALGRAGHDHGLAGEAHDGSLIPGTPKGAPLLIPGTPKGAPYFDPRHP